jgi:hypothetical protein
MCSKLTWQLHDKSCTAAAMTGWSLRLCCCSLMKMLVFCKQGPGFMSCLCALQVHALIDPAHLEQEMQRMQQQNQ